MLDVNSGSVATLAGIGCWIGGYQKCAAKSLKNLQTNYNSNGNLRKPNQVCYRGGRGQQQFFFLKMQAKPRAQARSQWRAACGSRAICHQKVLRRSPGDTLRLLPCGFIFSISIRWIPTQSWLKSVTESCLGSLLTVITAFSPPSRRQGGYRRSAPPHDLRPLKEVYAPDHSSISLLSYSNITHL